MSFSLITLWIDIAGVIIGLFSIWIIIQIKTQTGGESTRGLNLFVWGIVLMILAFTDSVVFLRLSLLLAFPVPPIDIHHILMTIGMLFFIIPPKLKLYC